MGSLAKRRPAAGRSSSHRRQRWRQQGDQAITCARKPRCRPELGQTDDGRPAGWPASRRRYKQQRPCPCDQRQQAAVCVVCELGSGCTEPRKLERTRPVGPAAARCSAVQGFASFCFGREPEQDEPSRAAQPRGPRDDSHRRAHRFAAQRTQLGGAFGQASEQTDHSVSPYAPQAGEFLGAAGRPLALLQSQVFSQRTVQSVQNLSLEYTDGRTRPRTAPPY